MKKKQENRGKSNVKIIRKSVSKKKGKKMRNQGNFLVHFTMNMIQENINTSTLSIFFLPWKMEQKSLTLEINNKKKPTAI